MGQRAHVENHWFETQSSFTVISCDGLTRHWTASYHLRISYRHIIGVLTTPPVTHHPITRIICSAVSHYLDWFLSLDQGCLILRVHSCASHEWLQIITRVTSGSRSLPATASSTAASLITIIFQRENSYICMRSPLDYAVEYRAIASLR